MRPTGKTGARQQPANETRAQVEEILAKHFRSLGDPASARNIRSRVMYGRVETSLANVTGTVERYLKLPDKSLSVIKLHGMGQFVEAYDGKSAWAQTPYTDGVVSLNPAAYENFKGFTEEGKSRLREMFANATLKGKAIVGEREAHVLELRQGKRASWTMYLDAGTGDLLRLDTVRDTMWAKGVRASLYYDGYTKIDGINFPTLIREVYPDITLTINILEIKHNVHIEDSMFDCPRGAREITPSSGSR